MQLTMQGHPSRCGEPLVLHKSTSHRNKRLRETRSMSGMTANTQVRSQETTERERSMAFMEGFSSEKPVVLEHMLGL
jgi:hypothetical protein